MAIGVCGEYELTVFLRDQVIFRLRDITIKLENVLAHKNKARQLLKV